MLWHGRKVIYVGVTNNKARRLSEHSQDKPWFSLVDDVTYDRHATREMAEMAEKRLIHNHQPYYNNHHSKQAPDHNQITTEIIKTEYLHINYAGKKEFRIATNGYEGFFKQEQVVENVRAATSNNSIVKQRLSGLFGVKAYAGIKVILDFYQAPEEIELEGIPLALIDFNF